MLEIGTDRASTKSIIKFARRKAGTARTATWLARARVSPFIQSKLLNHANELGGGSSITMSVYVQHDYLEKKREAIEALERLILAAVRPGTELEQPPPPALRAPARLLFHVPA